MQRTFCLHCGTALAADPSGRLLPCICLPPDDLAALEAREAEHWQEYRAAEDLATWHLKLHVDTEAGIVPVLEWIKQLRHPDLLREYPFRITGTHLVQLVYQRGGGTRLLKWPVV